MKRFHIFQVFFIFPVLFACQIPTAIEVRGTPELHFSAKMDLGSMFAQEMEESFQSSDFTLLRCVSTSNFTYLAYRDLFNEPLDVDDLPEGSEFDPITPSLPFVVTGSKDLINPADSKNIPFSGLGYLLDGFSFSKAKALIFVSGTCIIKKLKLGVSVNSGAEQEFEIVDSIPSKCDTGSDEYFKPAYPQGGHFIEMPLDGNDVIFKFRVFAEDETFYYSDFSDAHVRVELVVWLPLEFEAGSNGAEVTFPAAFFGDEGQDLFGRSPDAESAAMDIIESLSMIIKLNTNPFLGKSLIVSGGSNIEIEEQIKTNSLNLVFDEESMALINDPANVPFAPVFKVVYNSGDTLKFPRVFSATEIIFSARIKFMIDLKEPPGDKGEPGETEEPGEPDEPGEPEEPGEPGEG